MTMSPTHIILTFVLLPLLLDPVVAANLENSCVYTVYVRTGSPVRAGTDARISLTLGDANGGKVFVENLAAQWGLMGPRYDYFERGNLDIFAGRGSCLSAPICRLNLTSDGSGSHPGWFCDYVETTLIGEYTSCSQTLFYVRGWLMDDASPTVTVDGCEAIADEGRRMMRRGRFVIGSGYRYTRSNLMLLRSGQV